MFKSKIISENKGDRSLLKNYLLEKISLNPLFLLLTFLLIYDSHINDYVFYGTSGAVFLILIMLVIKAPRVIVHLFMIAWLIIVLYQAIFITANLSQDYGSDRDEAVEIATTNLLEGQNPWVSTSNLGNPITTGPTSILVAIPSVILTNKINSLTFIFWVLFFCSLIALEYYYKNNSFLLLFLFFLIPIFGFQHTIFYSLDELYYALNLISFASLVVKKKPVHLFWNYIFNNFF